MDTMCQETILCPAQMRVRLQRSLLSSRAVPTFVQWHFTHWRLSFCSGTTASWWTARWTWYAYKLWPAERGSSLIRNFRRGGGRLSSCQPSGSGTQSADASKAAAYSKQHHLSQSAAANRQQPPAGLGPRPPSRPALAGPNVEPGRKFSAAEQELEELKRRIAEKEKQMKAKRQTGQGFTGAPVRVSA